MPSNVPPTSRAIAARSSAAGAARNATSADPGQRPSGARGARARCPPAAEVAPGQARARHCSGGRGRRSPRSPRSCPSLLSGPGARATADGRRWSARPIRARPVRRTAGKDRRQRQCDRAIVAEVRSTNLDEVRSCALSNTLPLGLVIGTLGCASKSTDDEPRRTSRERFGSRTGPHPTWISTFVRPLKRPVRLGFVPASETVDFTLARGMISGAASFNLEARPIREGRARRLSEPFIAARRGRDLLVHSTAVTD